ncbi:hypothetical protein MPSEU_000732800 [Mayamaea pseudoterrestris]|nr:hypothetical protein MPSEU_000732800 [Mayamaea pseudoterrestris]
MRSCIPRLLLRCVDARKSPVHSFTSCTTFCKQNNFTMTKEEQASASVAGTVTIDHGRFAKCVIIGASVSLFKTSQGTSGLRPDDLQSAFANANSLDEAVESAKKFYMAFAPDVEAYESIFLMFKASDDKGSFLLRLYNYWDAGGALNTELKGLLGECLLAMKEKGCIHLFRHLGDMALNRLPIVVTKAYLSMHGFLDVPKPSIDEAKAEFDGLAFESAISFKPHYFNAYPESFEWETEREKSREEQLIDFHMPRPGHFVSSRAHEPPQTFNQPFAAPLIKRAPQRFPLKVEVQDDDDDLVGQVLLALDKIDNIPKKTVKLMEPLLTKELSAMKAELVTKAEMVAMTKALSAMKAEMAAAMERMVLNAPTSQHAMQTSDTSGL